jgi:transitional endoplasmic reticulum ATPase
MTSPATQALLSALQASPDNELLQGIVVQACISDDDIDSLAAVIYQYKHKLLLSPAVRVELNSFVKSCQREDLLTQLESPEAAMALLQTAKNLLEQGDRSAALAVYQQAIQLNPTVENPSLAAELSGKVVRLHGLSENRVRSISNDVTDSDDATRMLQPLGEKVTFSDVGGLEDVKQQIRRKIITPFLKPSLFDRFKRRAGGGILLYGPPGCGKTLLARATAGECGAKFFNVSITDVLDMYIGESERKLHAIFETARQASPSVIFFDEVEAIGGKRQYSREGSSAKLVSQFLTELDGFSQHNKGVLILGATNVPWAVDAAFRRPGRFDRVLFVPPPDLAARIDILSQLMEQRPSEGHIDLASVAKATASFSGADLRHLIETAVDEAIEQSIASGVEVPITMQHIKAALAQNKATTLEWLTSARNHARYSNQGGQYDEVLDFLAKHGNDK